MSKVFKMQIGWGPVAAVLGALINVVVQISIFFNNLETFQQKDTTLGEFFREFSWLMLGVTMLFFWVMGTLYQRKVDEREEAVEIAAELKAREARSDHRPSKR